MTPRAEYPLDPLLRVREARVDDATRAVAEAVHEVDATRDARAAAEAARLRAGEAAQAIRASERDVLEEGGLTAADLARADAWEAKIRDDDRRLFDAAARAAEAESRAVLDEARARAELAKYKVDADVVSKDRDAWTNEVRRRVEAKEEEDAEEAWRRKA